ncbi:MAG: DNA replication/repair protein RecF [Anaerovoracaceae bacterium]|jgi:DNA replication and repair protein RecF
MYISELSLFNYRNYEDERIEFDPGVNIIMGENAQGKTNLIESIYLCSLGKSFRTSRYRDLIRFGEDFCRVSVVFQREDESRIDMVVTRDGKKAAKIDGIKVQRISELLDHIISVVFSPEDLKIVKEDPAKRRNFMDREMSQLKLSYLNTLKLYNRVLSQRNAYLKENRDEKNGLYIWDEKLVEYGSFLMRERAAFMEKISRISGKIHQGITNGREKLRVKYRPSVKSDDENSIEDVFMSELEKNEEADFFNGNTSRGPHKDDFEVIVDDVNARYYGSQGQQRTAALSLKLAEIELLKEEKRENPILLLDDVLSELDSERQKYLVEYLHDVQLFITTTDITDEIRESMKGGRIIEIRGGKAFESKC